MTTNPHSTGNEMDPFQPLRAVKQDLDRQYQAAASTLSADPENTASQGYARGIKAALDIVTAHLSGGSGTDHGQTEETGCHTPALLHQMEPADVAKMDTTRILAGAYTTEDLIEAAFRFENMLMAILEDDNTLPWDAYTDLLPEQLASIIQKSAEEICRIQRG